MDLQPDGHRAVVTGAATGSGRATAEHLAAGGCPVAALDIDVTACQRQLRELEEAAGKLAGSVIALPADLSRAAGGSEGAAQATEALRVLDIAVNHVRSGAGRTDITMTTAARAQTIAAQEAAS